MQRTVLRVGLHCLSGNTAKEGMPCAFAAGDIVSGPRTVVDAVAFTKKVFKKMEEYLGTI